MCLLFTFSISSLECLLLWSRSLTILFTAELLSHAKNCAQYIVHTLHFMVYYPANARKQYSRPRVGEIVEEETLEDNRLISA